MQLTAQTLNGPMIIIVQMHYQLPRAVYLIALGKEIANAQNRNLRNQHHTEDIAKLN